MGIQDRDYMRDRSRKAAYEEDSRSARPFEPPREGPSMLVMLLVWASAALLLYRGYDWLQSRHVAPQGRVSGAAAVSALGEVTRHGTQASNPPQVIANHRVLPSASAQRQPAVQVTPRSSMQHESHEAPAQQSPGTIYLCKAYAGGTFWSQAHCNQHQALIDSIVPVPTGLPFEQQVALAEQRRRPTADVSTTNAGVRAEAVAAEAGRNVECKALDARVEQLDAMARQPQSAAMQDWIRGQRQAARDRQFALHC